MHYNRYAINKIRIFIGEKPLVTKCVCVREWVPLSKYNDQFVTNNFLSLDSAAVFNCTFKTLNEFIECRIFRKIDFNNKSIYKLRNAIRYLKFAFMRSPMGISILPLQMKMQLKFWSLLFNYTIAVLNGRYLEGASDI